MTPAGFALRVAAYLLAADGIAALALAGIVGPVGLGLVGAGMLASLGSPRLAERLGAGPRLASALVGVAAVAAVVDLVYLADTVLDGLVHLLLFLVVARLCTLRSPGDARVVAFLAFFMLVAASSASFGVSFLAVFVGYLLLATWLLLLQHLLVEAEPAPRRVVLAGGPAGSARGLLVLAAAAAATTLAITAVLFFVIPRVGLAALPFRGKMGPLVTGFSERVELGSYGQIQTDESVAMRVHIPEGVADPDRIPDLRWRGLAYDEFDGQAWRVGQPERMILRRAGVGPGDFRLAPPRGRGRALFQEFFLEPIGTDVLFAAARVLRITLRSEELTVDDMGSLSVGSASARLSYVVESELGEGPLTFPVRGRGPDPRTDPAFARYLELPRLPARIAALAREVAGDAPDAFQAAVRLSDHLSREYRYTLALERRTGLDPVDEFLFVRRSGNCEYFAAALAVMLRTLGIPSRVVGGFQRGDWNPYGRYFTVRMKDAHSWVEAYIAGAGWVTLDPSPRADAEADSAAPSAAKLYLDALRMRWYRYVINWSLRDQVEAAATIRRQAGSWRVTLASLPSWRDVPAWLAPGAALVLVAGAAWLWGARRAGPRATAVRRMPRFYARALRVLARRGLSPAPDETAREFARRVAASSPSRGAPFAMLTETYERTRFGARDLTPADQASVEAHLSTLSQK